MSHAVYKSFKLILARVVRQNVWLIDVLGLISVKMICSVSIVCSSVGQEIDYIITTRVLGRNGGRFAGGQITNFLQSYRLCRCEVHVCINFQIRARRGAIHVQIVDYINPSDKTLQHEHDRKKSPRTRNIGNHKLLGVSLLRHLSPRRRARVPMSGLLKVSQSPSQ